MNTLYTPAMHRPCVKPLAACLALALGIGTTATHVADATVGAGSASVATLAVSNCNDSGSGSLRDAVANAHSGDTVDLSALTCSQITLATGAIEIEVDDLTLQGPGATALTIAGSQRANHAYSVLNHAGHGTLSIDSLRITDDHAASSRCIESTGTVSLNGSTITYCSGGGVFANGFSALNSTIGNSYQGVYTLDGDVSIAGSTISGNGIGYSGFYGYGYAPVPCGGLHLGRPNTTTVATALISNTTISGNGAGYRYGKSYSGAGCIYEPVTISNSTIAFNGAYSGTGGLRIDAPNVSIESSIFANNSDYDVFAIIGTAISGHNNLIMKSDFVLPPDTITADPKLLSLADNGGPTLTHALAADSPAIDAGNNTAGLAYDQRGAPFARVYGAKADIGAFELQPPVVAIDSTFTGAWYDPAQSGHGIFVEVLPGNNLLAYWFTFDPAGDQQAWFLGVGPYSGNSAAITAVDQTTGGRWIPNFDPNKIVHNAWGSLTFTFTGHDHGKVDFNSVLGYGVGSMNLTRLTQPAAPSAGSNGNTGTIGPAFTGSWYDPAQSGHGLVLEVLPGNSLLAYWFTFNPAGNQQAWFGGAGTYSGNTATIMQVEQPTGGRWIPNFNPDTIVRHPWGTLTLTFTDCNHGKVDFNSVFGYGSGSMDLTRLTQPDGLTCP
jgi:hypothetical protein